VVTEVDTLLLPPMLGTFWYARAPPNVTVYGPPLLPETVTSPRLIVERVISAVWTVDADALLEIDEVELLPLNFRVKLELFEIVIL
jgi:hypothetical protein